MFICMVILFGNFLQKVNVGTVTQITIVGRGVKIFKKEQNLMLQKGCYFVFGMSRSDSRRE